MDELKEQWAAVGCPDTFRLWAEAQGVSVPPPGDTPDYNPNTTGI
jgi:hypothetical protein